MVDPPAGFDYVSEAINTPLGLNSCLRINLVVIIQYLSE